MMIKDRKEKERADEEGEIESRTRQREIRIDLVKKKRVRWDAILAFVARAFLKNVRQFPYLRPKLKKVKDSQEFRLAWAHYYSGPPPYFPNAYLTLRFCHGRFLGDESCFSEIFAIDR